MQYSRSFKLLPYWKDFKRLVTDVRKGIASPQLLSQDRGWLFGGQSVILNPDLVKRIIEEDLDKIYHKNGLTLKIFDLAAQPLEAHIYNATWGHNPVNDPSHLVETSKIQNYHAAIDLAPRIHDLVFLEEGDKKYAAQVTQLIGGKGPTGQLDDIFQKTVLAVTRRCGQLGILLNDMAMNNYIQGKFVDFQRFSFAPSFRPKLIVRIMEGLRFGERKMPYQSIEELHITGLRSNFHRNKIFSTAFKKDKKLLPENFTVVDYGCNAGFFLRRAMDWGAGYGVGVDQPDTIVLAEEISLYLGYFNLDYMSAKPEGKFDLAFYLSMSNHLPFEQFVGCVGNILYFEGHAQAETFPAHSESECRKLLEPHFKEVELLGETKDYPEGQPRLLFRCKK